MKVLYNDENDNLWYIGCKEKINLGEKYLILKEDYFDGKLEKIYHPQCVPEMEDDE